MEDQIRTCNPSNRSAILGMYSSIAALSFLLLLVSARPQSNEQSGNRGDQNATPFGGIFVDDYTDVGSIINLIENIDANQGYENEANVFVNDELVSFRYSFPDETKTANQPVDIRRAGIVTAVPGTGCYFLTAPAYDSSSSLDSAMSLSSSSSSSPSPPQLPPLVSETFYYYSPIITPDFAQAVAITCFRIANEDLSIVIAVEQSKQDDFMTESGVSRFLDSSRDVMQLFMREEGVYGQGRGGQFDCHEAVTIHRAAIVHEPFPGTKCRLYDQDQELLAEFTISEQMLTPIDNVWSLVCVEDV